MHSLRSRATSLVRNDTTPRGLLNTIFTEAAVSDTVSFSRRAKRVSPFVVSVLRAHRVRQLVYGHSDKFSRMRRSGEGRRSVEAAKAAQSAAEAMKTKGEEGEESQSVKTKTWKSVKRYHSGNK